MKTLKTFLMFCFLAIFLAAVGIFLAMKYFQAYSPGEPSWETTVKAMVDPRSLFPGKSDLYVLVMGTDHNFTDKDIIYTTHADSDTMMLFHLDLQNKTVKALSIPRDTYIYIPGDCYHGDCYDKINAAIETGGPKLAEKVVTSLTGIPVDNFVHIKLEGLKNLVDAIGGVDVYVDEEMNYDDNWGHLHIHLKKGLQHLDGEHALEFARFRHDALGDYARIERQQRMIKAIAKKLESPVMLTRLHSIVEVAKDNVETDFTLPQLFALADLFKGEGLAGVQTFTLPTYPKDVKVFGDWVSYVFVDRSREKDVTDQFTADAPPAPQGPAVSVEVLNGSGVAGIADQVADMLRSHGYLVSRVGNADSFSYAKTQIEDHTSTGAGVQVAALFAKDDAQLLSIPENPRKVDVTVIVGKNQTVAGTETQ